MIDYREGSEGSLGRVNLTCRSKAYALVNERMCVVGFQRKGDREFRRLRFKCPGAVTRRAARDVVKRAWRMTFCPIGYVRERATGVSK